MLPIKFYMLSQCNYKNQFLIETFSEFSLDLPKKVCFLILTS